jgi:hypothetical protein
VLLKDTGRLILYTQLFCMCYANVKKRHQAQQNPLKYAGTLAGQGTRETGTHFLFAGLGRKDNESDVKLLKVELTTKPATLHVRTRETIQLPMPHDPQEQGRAGSPALAHRDDRGPRTHAETRSPDASA